jgi:hypothetical protein
VIALRHAEQVGDDQHGERLAVPADELASATVDELVDLAVGEAPHELLVLAQALRRDQAHEQRTVRGVDRRVERVGAGNSSGMLGRRFWRRDGSAG